MKIIILIFKSHPIAYSFLLYVLVLITFAIIYSEMPGSFYHTTIIHEPSIQAMKDDICNGIGNAIIHTISRNSKDKSPTIGDWEIKNVLVSKLNKDNNYLSADIYLFAVNKNPKEFARIEVMYTILISTNLGINTPLFEKAYDDKGNVFAKEVDSIYYVREIKIADLHYNVDRVNSMPFLLRDIHPSLSYKDAFEYCIESTEELENNLVTIIKSFNGIPENDPERFFRMIYLSIVTLTTLGYGDIVPITIAARLWISLEAFLGPVLLGVFLFGIGEKFKFGKK